MKKFFGFLIIIDILFIIFNLKTRFVFLDFPVILLLVLSVWYWRKPLKKTIKRHYLLLTILFFSFLVRFFGIFYPEHYGVVEQEVYTLPMVASYSGRWLETFKDFTSFEILGLFIQGWFFELTTYFDFKLFINWFHFLFPRHYYFLNIPSPDIFHWPSWSADGTYGGLLPYQVDRYALNYFLIRLVSVILGTLTVLLTYLSAKKLFGKSVALFSSLVLGFTFIHVVMSMMGRQYVIATFFIAFSFLFACFIVQNGKLVNYLLCGALIGIVNAVKVFPASIVFLFAAFALDLFYNRKKQEILWKRSIKKFFYLFSAGISILVFFLVSSPTLFAYPEIFFSRVQTVMIVVSGNFWTWKNYYMSSIGLPNWIWWPRFLAQSGLYLPLFLVVLFGLAITLYQSFRRKKEDILLLSATLPYLYLLFNSGTRREEFIVFITPFLAIFAGFFIVQLIKLIQKANFYDKKTRKLIIVFFLLFTLGIPAGRIVLFDYSINTADNRTKTANWINKNIPNGDFIYVVGPYTQRLMLPKDKYLVATEDHLSQNFDYYSQIGVDYLLVPAIKDLGQFIYHPEEYTTILNSLNLLNNAQLKAEFYKPFFKQEFFSPIVTLGDLINEHFDNSLQIYKLNKDDNLNHSLLKLDGEFLSSPPLSVPRVLNNFALVEDKETQKGESLLANQKGASLEVMPFLGRGKYKVTFRLKVNYNYRAQGIAVIRMGSSWTAKDLGIYLLRGSEFRDFNQFQNFNYDLNFPDASRLFLNLETLIENDVYLESISIERMRE